MEYKLFVATKAFIIYKNKVLILRESKKYKDGSNSEKYDVVGGRIRPGQRFDKSLLREINEETGLKVVIGEPFYVGEWRPKVGNENWQIVGTFFRCIAKGSKVKLSIDHDDFQWINPEDY